MLRVVKKSRFWSDKIRDEIKNTDKYIRIKEVILETVSLDTVLPPSFTATTEFG